MQLTILPNGLKVASREMPSLETAAVGLYAEAGSRHEPARLNGIAHLFEHMVFKGAGGRSAREISEAIEDVGGDLNACTERDRPNLMARSSPSTCRSEWSLSTTSDSPHFVEADPSAEEGRPLKELGEARTRVGHIFDVCGPRL